MDSSAAVRPVEGDIRGISEARSNLKWYIAGPFRLSLRTSSAEIKLFDGTGVGLQDLAVAPSVVELAVDKRIGIEVDV